MTTTLSYAVFLVVEAAVTYFDSEMPNAITTSITLYGARYEREMIKPDDFVSAEGAREFILTICALAPPWRSLEHSFWDLIVHAVPLARTWRDQGHEMTGRLLDVALYNATLVPPGKMFPEYPFKKYR